MKHSERKQIDREDYIYQMIRCSMDIDPELLGGGYKQYYNTFKELSKLYGDK